MPIMDVVESVITACHNRKRELGLRKMLAGGGEAPKAGLISVVGDVKRRVAALERQRRS